MKIETMANPASAKRSMNRPTADSQRTMNSMKATLTLALSILVSTVCLNAQTKKSDGLYMTGTIVGLNAIAECTGTDGRILAQVELSMQIRNSSDRPLIVFKPEKFSRYIWSREPVAKRVLFLKTLPSANDKEIEKIQVNEVSTNECRPVSTNYYNDRNYDPIKEYINQIDGPTPFSSDRFAVIDPRGYYEFREIIKLDLGWSAEVKLGKSLKESRVRAEYPAFQVQYHLSLKGHEKGEDFLQQLRSRWNTVGNLVLDGNGDFNLISEPIISTSIE